MSRRDFDVLNDDGLDLRSFLQQSEELIFYFTFFT